MGRVSFGQGTYRPDLWEDAVRKIGGSLPCEWTWYTHRRGNVAICCGIVGGNDSDFIAYYADKAIERIQFTE
jgi:hypothetical protein